MHAPLTGNFVVHDHHRKGNPEGGSFPLSRAERFNAATVQFHNPSRDGESEPEASVGARGRAVPLTKPLEQMRHKFFPNADAGVADREFDVRVDALQTQLDTPAPRRELDGV